MGSFACCGHFPLLCHAICVSVLQIYRLCTRKYPGCVTQFCAMRRKRSRFELDNTTVKLFRRKAPNAVGMFFLIFKLQAQELASR